MRILVLLLTTGIASSAIAGKGAADRAGRWFRVSMNGTHVGSAFEVEEKRATGNIVTRTVQVVRLQRGGDLVDMQEEVRYEETADGAPIRLERRSRMSNQQGEVAVATVLPGTSGIELVSTVGGRSDTQRIATDRRLRFPYGQRRRARETGFKAGAVYETVWFFPELKSVDAATVRVGAAQSITLDSRTVSAIPIEASLTKLPIKMREWVNTAGDTLRLETEVGGFRVVADRVLGESAASVKTGAPLDILEMTAVRSNRRIKTPRAVASATYRIESRQGGLDAAKWTGPGQKLVERRESWRRIRVTRIARGEPDPGTPEGQKAYTAPTSVAQSDDASIRRVAKHIVRGEADAWKRLKRVEAWVHHALSKKSYRVTFASAKEVLETREGDCTEHSVLVVALLRALGVPARGVFGLVYTTGLARGEFGYHMWAEARLDGKWIPLDATLWAPAVDATHIRLGDSDLANPLADFAAIIPVVASGLRIDVIE
ncbi:MAG: transglutaminase domain-containing protein, partial [Deltaproteobacteria bacterium]|nr:transglutaminase domain-containing protein [Deltaproteobacteria bacterium]